MSKTIILKRAFSDGKSILINLPQPLKDIFRMSSKLTKTKSCLKVAINTGVVMATGDVIAQCLLERNGVRKWGWGGGDSSFGGGDSSSSGEVCGKSGNNNDGNYDGSGDDSSSRDGDKGGDIISRGGGDDDFKTKRFDWLRLSRFLAVGLFIAGPGMFYWYGALDRWIVIGSLRSRALKKLAADQILFLPCYIFVYMVSLGVLRRDGLPRLTDQVKNQFGSNLIASYKLWPAVQLVNFLLVPGHFRVPLINFFALFWNVYLGWKTETANKM